MRHIAALGLTLSLYSIPAALWSLDLRHYVTYFVLVEDGLYESIGALACLSGSLLLASASLLPGPGMTRQRGWYLLFALGLLLMFLEETSWGQRVFQFSTPNYFQTENVVGETNLHNLRTFYLGDLETNFLQLAWMVLVVGYLGGLPYLAWWHKPATLMDKFQIPVPSRPMAAATWANMALFITTLYMLRHEPPIVAGQHATELFEVNAQLLLFAIALRAFLNTPGSQQRDWSLAATGFVAGAVGIALLRLSLQNNLPLARSIGKIQQGQRLAAAGKLTQALMHFEASASLWPQNALAQHAQGTVLEAMGKQEQALGAYQAAIDLVPTFAAAHVGVAKIYMAQERISEAQAHLAEALANDPSIADAWNLRGILLVKAGDREGGIESFRKALSLAPEHTAAAENLRKVTAATHE